MLLLLNVLAYEIVHATRVLLEHATVEGWSMKRVRQRVLGVAALVLVHSGRAVFVVGTSSAQLWETLWRKLHVPEPAWRRTSLAKDEAHKRPLGEGDERHVRTIRRGNSDQPITPEPDR